MSFTRQLPPSRRSAGFTLVELLLAVTLMSLLMALAYGGFSAATKASISGQVLLEQTGKLRITHQFVRRQLNLMLPLNFESSASGDGELVMFVGDSRRIQFVGPMPGYLGQGGPQVQVMELVEGDQGLELAFSHAVWEGFLPEWIHERPPVVLLEGLEFAAFEFLGRDEEGMMGAWQGSWEHTTTLPVAVRLDVNLGDESRVTWPVMTAGIRLDEEAVRQAADVRDYSDTIRDLIRNRGEKEE